MHKDGRNSSNRFSGKKSIKQVEKLTSMVYYAGLSTDGEIQNSENMMGKFIHNLASSDEDVLAFSNFGIFKLSESEPISNIKFLTAGSGKSFLAGLTQDGDLYSWGVGQTGDLGQGLLYQQLMSPMKIEINASFLSVSSGENHSVAVDSFGNAYAWGQNFDRQLGLYTKEQEEMKTKTNCMIEDLVFAPRFLPFSLSLPIEKVSCGAKYSIFLSRSGEVWSCGAGECGQLGTGRCTKSAVPKRVPLPNNDVIIDIAAGWGHVLAASENGYVYSWGFNRFGQLGVNDTATKHTPTLLSNGVTLQRVFAHGNSSAGLCAAGRLYTWGSSTNHRLMHGKSQTAHVLVPKLVEFLKDTIVQCFAFSKTASAAMVLSRLTDLFPLSGPQKSFQQLEITGCGFWPSEDIVVKFSCIGGSGFAAPRSCPGWLQSPGVVACKPPRLGEAGKYEVIVAMDGSTFLPDKLIVNAYKDFNLVSISPGLIDRRIVTRTEYSVVVKGISELPENNSIAVRVLVSRDPNPGSGETEIIDLVGYFKEDDADANENGSTGEEGSHNKSSAVEVVNDRKIVCFDLDFDQITSIDRSEVAYVNVQLTLNNLDYCPCLPASKAAILHSFEPSSLLPSCFALEADDSRVTEKREVAVCGSGFIKSAGLRWGSQLEAVFKARVAHTVSEIVLPVTCLHNDRIYLSPPSVAQFVHASGVSIDPSLYPTLLRTSVRLQLSVPSAAAELAAEKAEKASRHSHSSQSDSRSQIDATNPELVEIIPLSSKHLELQLYTPQGISVSPTVYKASGEPVLTLLGTLRGGFKLRSSQVRVLFFEPDSGFEYLTDVGMARMIPTTEAVTPETFTAPLPVLVQSNDDPTISPSDSRPQTAMSDADSVSVSTHDTKKSKGSKGKKKAPAQVVEPPEEEFKVVLKLPQFQPKSSLPDEGNEEAVNTISSWFDLRKVRLSVLLDGQTPVPYEMSTQIVFFEAISIKPLGKGPFAPGTSLNLEVSGLVRTNWTEQSDPEEIKCIVRLHAESNEATRTPSHDVSCLGNVSSGVITVTLPDASQFQGLETEPPAKGAKAKAPKNYFIGVSIDDGNSFDYSDKAILPVK